jgi:hypothetical protein
MKFYDLKQEEKEVTARCIIERKKAMDNRKHGKNIRIIREMLKGYNARDFSHNRVENEYCIYSKSQVTPFRERDSLGCVYVKVAATRRKKK